MIRVRNWCSNFYLKFKNESFTGSYFLKRNPFPEQVFQNTRNKHIFLSYYLKLSFQYNNLFYLELNKWSSDFMEENGFFVSVNVIWSMFIFSFIYEKNILGNI